MSQPPAPTPNEKPAPTPPPPAERPSTPPPAQAASAQPGPVRRVWVLVAAVLLVGWLAWLSYTALTKSRQPTVSHAQAAGATVAVVAEVKLVEGEQHVVLTDKHSNAGQPQPLSASSGKPAFIVEVKEWLVPNRSPADNEMIGVANLPNSTGFTTEGKYLLLLNKFDGATIDGHSAYLLAGLPSSPGANFSPNGPARIYPWSEDLRAQVKQLFPRRE